MTRSENIRDAFVQQGQACASLGSQFMGRLKPLLGQRLTPDTAVGARCLAWQGEAGPSGDSVPLRLAGALNGLALDGSAPELAKVYPPHPSSDTALWQAVEAAFHTHERRILTWLDRAPQTNEVRRAAAVIAGVWWALGAVGPRQVVLSELGASAGLNLMLDHFAVALDGTDYGPAEPALTLKPDWRGAQRPVPQPITVSARGGVDLAPLDPAAPGDQLRLLAYLWPDQPERLARTRAAIAVATARPDAEDAASWVGHRLAQPAPGQLHVVYTTIAAQYFSSETKSTIADHLAQAGRAASADAPLLHLAMEADGTAPGAALFATLWRGGAPEQTHLGRVQFHGDWIAWGPRVADVPFYPLSTR